MSSYGSAKSQGLAPRDSTLQVAGDFYAMVGKSAAMRRVYERIERFARSPVPILILGETGVGKDVAAQAIRQIMGPERPFLAVNCAAIPNSLIESELFGHEQGAFTGASRRHAGILAQANGGILFLDEVAELPLHTQTKLLRVIESGEYRTVGGERTLRSQFRIIAATNCDLDTLVAEKRFRLDLFHRLGAARVVIPPVRDRREDIPALAEHFLLSYRTTNGGMGPIRLSSRALELLNNGTWVGNLREFRNVIEAAASAARGDTIEEIHIAEFIRLSEFEISPDQPLPKLGEAARRAEQQLIREALRRTGGDRDRAAVLLGVSATTLYRRMVAPGRSCEDRSGE